MTLSIWNSVYTVENNDDVPYSEVNEASDVTAYPVGQPIPDAANVVTDDEADVGSLLEEETSYSPDVLDDLLVTRFEETVMMLENTTFKPHKHTEPQPTYDV